MKIGILREGKIPPDSRVPLTPKQCLLVQKDFNIKVAVQPSDHRCYSNDEYRESGIDLSDDLEDCDFILGVKEVPVPLLPADKTCCFFSHTIKAQPYNRDLLRAVLRQNVRLIDYEVLTTDQGQRLVAFGSFAGMVGAHNALWTWAQRSGAFQLPRMHEFHDYAAATKRYQQLALPKLKIVLTGGGRVAMGAHRTLTDLNIHEVTPEELASEKFDDTVFARVDCQHYAARTDGSKFRLPDFYDDPFLFHSTFGPWQEAADIMINGIFWDRRAPAFFTLDEMASPSFAIDVIADVTCDIAPDSSIPSTLRATSIKDPVFGFEPSSGMEIAPHSAHGIDMMTVDNLPNELPRDASLSFGEQLIQHLLPELLAGDSELLRRATVAADGELGPHFTYLEDYVSQKSS